MVTIINGWTRPEACRHTVETTGVLVALSEENASEDSSSLTLSDSETRISCIILFEELVSTN